MAVRKNIQTALSKHIWFLTALVLFATTNNCKTIYIGFIIFKMNVCLKKY